MRHMPVTRKNASLAIARLMPYIMRGVQLDFFLTHGVTQTQFLVLASIRAYERCTMGALARSLSVSMPTASGLVDRLARAGFIRRTHESEDRRQVSVELTPKGKTFFHEFEAVIRTRWEEALLSLTRAELSAFHDAIVKITTQLQRQA